MSLVPGELDTWKVRLQNAQALQQSQHKHWHEAHRMYEGTWLDQWGGAGTEQTTHVNYTTAYVRTVVSAIYARNPYWFVNGRHRQFTEFGKSQEIVLNYLKQELNLKSEIKRNVQDCLLDGIAWNEIGFTASFDTLEPQTDSGKDPNLFQRLLGKKAATPSEQGELNEFIKAIAAYSKRISPWNVLMAPGYHAVNEMPYLIVGQDIAPEDLENSPFYAHELDLRRIKATRTVQTGDQLILGPSKRPTGIGTANQGLVSGAEKDGLQLVRLYHVWDRRNRQRFVMFDDSDESAGPFPWPYSFEGFPQVPLIFNEIPETDRNANPYPLSDIRPMIPLLRELHLLRQAMVTHRKRSGTLILTTKGSLTDAQRQQLQSGDDVSIVEVDDPKGIVAHSPPTLPADIYRVNDRILADLDLVGGFSQVFLAAPPQGKGDRTATEVRVEAQGTNFRTAEKIDVIEEFSKQIAKRLAAVAWEFYPRELIRQILGETELTETMWPTLPEDPEERREIIERELEFTIEAGSTQPIKDKTMRNEQRIRFLNVAAGVAPERLKRGRILTDLAEDLEFTDAQELFITDDEKHAEHAQRENELLLKDIPQLVGPDELDGVHINIHSQAVQQNGGKSTPAMDQHIMEHSKRQQEKGPQNRAQSGDAGGTRGVASNPEALRQGSPEAEDLGGPLNRALAERGTQQGGPTF